MKDSNRKIFAKFSDEYDKWSNAAYNIAVLDCLISLAEYARTCDTCIPIIYDDTDNEGVRLFVIVLQKMKYLSICLTSIPIISDFH